MKLSKGMKLACKILSQDVNALQEIAEIYLLQRCAYCLRLISDKYWLTKNGCKWCDASYYRKKKK